MGFDVSGMGASFSAMSAMEKFTVAATALSAISQISQGNQQKKLANYQADQAMADAVAEREAGEVRAAKVRRSGRSQQSEARASLAAGGVEVGSGTALTIGQKIEESAEERAMQEILYGTRAGARLEQEAAGFRAAGRNAQTAGYARAGSSILSSGSAYYNTRSRGARAEQAPAPVEDRVLRIN